jgi:hypothetical protein
MIQGMYKSLYVIVQHYGSEGHAAPSQVFESERDARAALALLSASGLSTWKLYSVPVWPEPASSVPPEEIVIWKTVGG